MIGIIRAESVPGERLSGFFRVRLVIYRLPVAMPTLASKRDRCEGEGEEEDPPRSRVKAAIEIQLCALAGEDGRNERETEFC